jgi:hypothetical protein
MICVLSEGFKPLSGIMNRKILYLPEVWILFDQKVHEISERVSSLLESSSLNVFSTLA